MYRELDLTQYSTKTQGIKDYIEQHVVGQKEGIDALVDVMERYTANLIDPTRPIGSLLFLGPTGSGKTKLVESFCEAIYGDEQRMIKIDCGEFQHSHEIAKLIGSPPGYLGHRETPPRLKQTTIDNLQTKEWPLTIILFDEIEKASDSLWHLMLGILDKATITMGDNSQANFSKCIIIMTSNAGSTEMVKSLSGNSLGFVSSPDVDEGQIADIGINAAKKKFTPEFINRLDKIVAFHSLSKDQITQIADIELNRLQRRILIKANPVVFFKCSPAAKEKLIDIGFDPKYNGRNIRRAIERELGIPLAKIIAQRLNKPADTLIVDYKDGFKFGIQEV